MKKKKKKDGLSSKKRKLKPLVLKLGKSSISLPLEEVMAMTKWHRNNLKKNKHLRNEELIALKHYLKVGGTI